MQTDPRVLPIAGMRLHLDLRKLGPPLGIAALFLVALAVYRPHVTDFFAADDFVFLQSANRHGFLDYVSRAFSFPEATPFDLETPLWRPLVDLYFYLWWRLFSFDPLPYHLANVLLHGAVAALAARLIRQLTGSWLTGLLALLLCRAADVRHAVTWISDITELLAAFWYLLALVLYVAFLRGGRWAELAVWRRAGGDGLRAAHEAVLGDAGRRAGRPRAGRIPAAHAERPAPELLELTPFVVVTAIY
jgi:hypothetical protein